jgi:glycerophosphoryl diester phosphodiesterase
MHPFLPALLILSTALAACTGDEGSGATGALAPAASSWSIAPEDDLNGFFECLESANVALVSAHRGGPASGYPENALETMQKTLAEIPAILEIDIATSSDGVLYLMHDDTLDRTTTGSGAIDGQDWAAISALKLRDNDGAVTAFSPPRFSEALAWAKDRTILSIDFKRSTRYEDVIDEIKRQGATDRVILIAYTMAQAQLLHRLLPGAMISLSLSTQSDLNRTVAAGVPAERLIGFTGIEDPKPRLFSILNNQDIEVIFGTLGGPDSFDKQIEASGDDGTYAELAGMGVDIIATDRPGPAQGALDAAGRGAKPGQCGVART